MHDKNYYLSFFRYYKDEKTSPDFAWWYCLTDADVYETDELYQLFRYSSKAQIYQSGLFVEFDKLDVIELKKQFLLQRNEFGPFKDVPDEKFDLEFNKYIDKNNLIPIWYDFETAALESAFHKWCRANNIIFKHIP